MIRAAAILKHTPNECERDAANTQRSDKTFAADVFGCRQGEVKEERVYTLPRVPRVYNKDGPRAVASQRRGDSMDGAAIDTERHDSRSIDEIRVQTRT